MTLVELTPPELGGEATDSQSIPLREPALGVDDRVAEEFRKRLVGNPAEFPPLGNRTRDETSPWTWDEVVTYGHWLCDLLETDPNDPESQPPGVVLLDKASPILKGPSTSTIYNVRQNGVGELHKEIGFKKRIGVFKDLGIVGVLAESHRLAAENEGRRPGVKEVEKAAEAGEFLGLASLYHHIGNLTVLHEIMGLPSGRGWGVEDWVDLAVAYKIQNGNDAVFDYPTIVKLNGRHVAPTPRPLYNLFDTVEDLDTQADEAYRQLVEEEQETRYQQSQMIEELQESDEEFDEHTNLMSYSEIRRVWGGYRLIKDLVPDTDNMLALDLASQITSYEISDWITAYRPDLKFADIKHKAQELEVMNVLWPYRFHNANLVLDNPSRKSMPVSKTFEEITDSPAPQSEAEFRRAESKQRRLARLATHGLGIKPADEADGDPNKYARQAKELSFSEMAELQALIRKGARKARRLALGETLDASERRTLERHIAAGKAVQMQFVEANQGLVTSLVYPRFEQVLSHEKIEEVVHAGKLGLMKALNMYSPEKGFQFSVYSRWWINQYTFECVRHMRVGVHLTRNDETHLRAALNRDSGGNKKMEIDDKSRELRVIRSSPSLDAQLNDDESGATLHDVLAADNMDVAQRALTHVEIVELLSMLSPLERQVISIEFSLDYSNLESQGQRKNFKREKRAITEVASIVNLPQSVVRRLSAKALTKLREFAVRPPS